jgi:HEAT repeat protein
MPARLDNLICVLSQKAEWILVYLDELAEQAAYLPEYFPSRFKQTRPDGKPAFDVIRQQLQVIEDRERFDQEQSKLIERVHLENGGESPYSVNAKDVIIGELEERMKDKKPITFTWDERTLNRYPRLVVLGDPGYGKSWLLQFEARHRAVQQAKELRARRIDLEALCLPILVRLDQIAPYCQKTGEGVEQALADLLKKAAGKSPPFDLVAFLTEKLQNGQCMLLFDAWDEVPGEQRAKCATALHEFFKRYKKPKVLLSSRIVGYSGKPLPDGKEVELLGFDRKQQAALVKIWYGENEKAIADFIQASQSQPNIRYLLRIPLMLNLALCCHQYHKTRPNVDRRHNFFPTRRVELFEHCLWGFLTLWHQEKKKGSLIDDQKIEAWLDQLALAAFNLSAKEQELFTAKEFLAALNSENTPETWSFLQTLQQRGVLVRFRDELNPQLMFLHRAFQECLCARHLKNLIESTAIKPKMRQRQQEQGWRIVEEWSWNPDRDIILELLAGQLDEPRPMLELLADASTDGYFRGRLVLAAKCLAEIGESKQRALGDAIERIRHDVMNFIEVASITNAEAKYPNLPELMDPALVALGRLEHKNCGKNVINFLMKQKSFDLLAKVATNAAIQTLLKALAEDTYEYVPPSARYTTFGSLTEQSFAGNELIRIRAANALGQAGFEISVTGLLKALEEDSFRYVRESAAEALGLIGSKAAVLGLIKALMENNVWYHVAEALGQTGSDAAVPYLLKFLEHNHIPVRKKTAEVLGEIGSEAAVSGLLKALTESNNWEVEYAVIKALGSIGSGLAEPALIKELSSYGMDTRKNAAISLALIGSKAAVPALLKALAEEKNEEASATLATCLYFLGSEEGILGLMRMLIEAKNEHVREDAASVLGKIGSATALPSLVTALTEDEFANVRAEAAIALGEIGSDMALPNLLAALMEDKAADVRSAAAWALGEIGSENAISDLLKALTHEEYDVDRSVVAEALGSIGSEVSVPALIKLLEEDMDRYVRKSSVIALGKIKSEAALLSLLKVLHEDKNVWVKEAAVEVLSQIRLVPLELEICRWIVSTKSVDELLLLKQILLEQTLNTETARRFKV